MGNRVNFLSGTYSRIGLVLVLASVFLLGMVGIAGAVNPASTPLIHVSYVVHNDSDSGYTGGYWALDNYTQGLTIWQTAPGVYEVNVTNVGTWCTFAGDKSPNGGVVEATDECGKFVGGYDGNLTTNIAAVNTTQTTVGSGVLNFGGEKIGLGSPSNTPTDTMDAYDSWINYFFPGATPATGFPSNFAFANFGNGWSWTYTTPSGAVYVDSGTVANTSTGDIVAQASGSVVAIASAIPGTCSLSATGAIDFGDVIPGNGRVAAQTPVTVTNGGSVSTDVSIYGSDWSSTHDGDEGAGSVGWTVYNVGATYNPTSTLTGSAVDTGVNLAPAGNSDYSFGLSVPADITPATLTQIVTFVSSC